MLSVWLKKIRNSLGILSLGFFVNCEAKSLEYMAEKYSFFDGIEVVKVNEIEDEKKVIWIDVRPKEERDVSVIEGSLTEAEFLEKRELSEFKNFKFVAYCTVGHRSGKFAQRMQKKGISVSNLYGGILSWVEAGKVVLDSQGDQTKRVHVYGSDWNILPEGYEGVW